MQMWLQIFRITGHGQVKEKHQKRFPQDEVSANGPSVEKEYLQSEYMNKPSHPTVKVDVLLFHGFRASTCVDEPDLGTRKRGDIVTMSSTCISETSSAISKAMCDAAKYRTIQW